MKKKALALVLSVAMMATMLSACGGNSGTSSTDTSSKTESSSTETASSTDTAAPAEDELAEHVTIKWYLEGSNVSDDTEVMAAVNEYLGEKLNMTLEPIWGTWGDFDEGASLSLQSGDDVDIYFTCSWTTNEYSQYAKDGYYVRLDDPENNLLEKYAPDLLGLIPDVLVDGANVEGASGFGVYAVPGYKDIANQYCWDVNVTLLEKYGYTIKDIEDRTFFEFGDILETVKQGEGANFFPLLPETSVLERCVNRVAAVDDNGLLSYYFNPENPSEPLAKYGNVFVNKFATEEFKAYADQMREYYQKGYIDPECANSQTSTETRKAHQLEASYLIGCQSYAYGYEAQASQERGVEVQFVPCEDPYIDTISSRGAMMAISTASKNPERAMMFLNLLNTDPYLMTLLEYGVEGVHYTLNDDGCVVFTDKRADYTPWRNGMGNITILPPQEGEGVGYVERFKEYYGSSHMLPTTGFTFDTDPVETEVAACKSIVEEYSTALYHGSSKEGMLEEMLERLDGAGMQKIVDEANSQLQEFLKNK